MQNNASQKYLEQQILSASPARLVAMLFDRAIVSLNEAIEAIEAGHIERRWKANKRATEILYHLWETLDFEHGGEIAENMARLYVFMLQRLVAIDVENSQEAAREVIRLLEPLRRSWHELATAEPKEAGPTGDAEGKPGEIKPISLSA